MTSGSARCGCQFDRGCWPRLRSPPIRRTKASSSPARAIASIRLNSRLPDVRDAPQSISIIPREVIEQQSATTLRDVLRNVSGISMAAGEGGGGPAGDNLTLRGFGCAQRHFRRRHPRFRQLHARHVQHRAGRGGEGSGVGADRPRIDRRLHQPVLQAAAVRARFVGGTVGVGAPGYVRTTADFNVGGGALGLGGGAALRFNRCTTMPTRRAATMSRRSARHRAFGRVRPRRRDPRDRCPYVLLDQDNVPDYGIPFVPATHTGLAEYARRAGAGRL